MLPILTDFPPRSILHETIKRITTWGASCNKKASFCASVVQ